MSADEVNALVQRFMDGFWNGEATKCTTDDCLFNPPGAPPMPIGDMLGMLTPCKVAFPDWSSKAWGAEKNADGTWTVLTQQVCGAMKADLAAMGPFPTVALSSVPDVAKTPLAFPVEVGTFTLSADSKLIKSGSYAGATRDVSGATVSPEIAAIWNKKGDLSDVGFGCMFKMMGVDLPPPPAGPPDMLMTAHVHNFDDWFVGFKAHSTEKSFPMNGTTYTVSMARGEACDDAKTDVLCDVNDKNMIAIAMFGLDMAKFAPVMGEPAFVEMSAKAIKSQDPPSVLADMPAPDAPPPAEKPDVFFTYEVADVDKWVEGFLAHGTSKTGTWGVEAKYTRAEICNEAKTRVFKSAYNSKRVGAMLYAVDLAKMGEFMGDPSFAKISEVLAVKPETMIMKRFAPAPAL